MWEYVSVTAYHVCPPHFEFETNNFVKGIPHFHCSSIHVFCIRKFFQPSNETFSTFFHNSSIKTFLRVSQQKFLSALEMIINLGK